MGINLKKKVNQFLLLILLFGPFLFFYYLSQGKHQFGDLPVYGKINEIPFLKDENQPIIILEWTKDQTYLRTIYEKIFSKKKNFYFISYFQLSDELDIEKTENYKKRIKINLEKWNWFYTKEEEFTTLFAEFIPFFKTKNLDFQNNPRMYVLLDQTLQIRGIYEAEDLKKLEEDLRLLHKKSRKK